MGRHNFNFKQREKIYLREKGKCGDCHKSLKAYWYNNQNKYNPKRVFTIEDGEVHHIIRVIDGGRHTYDNSILLCKECHLKRHGKKRKKNG